MKMSENLNPHQNQKFNDQLTRNIFSNLEGDIRSLKERNNILHKSESKILVINTGGFCSHDDIITLEEETNKFKSQILKVNKICDYSLTLNENQDKNKIEWFFFPKENKSQKTVFYLIYNIRLNSK